MGEAHKVFFVVRHELVFLPVKVGSGVGTAVDVAINIQSATHNDQVAIFAWRRMWKCFCLTVFNVGD